MYTVVIVYISVQPFEAPSQNIKNDIDGVNVVDGVNRDGKGKKLQEGEELNGKANVVLLRTEENLDQCDVLVIPGGETTTIAFLARLSGLLDPPKKLIETKPAQGGCAGAILLSKVVMGAKKGGQEILGGKSVMITRNQWGPQVESSEASLEIPGLKR
ncbi:hypothetical protein K435DRAFT_873845 [Dendrothele bispora CBS 962.96]|uniref:Uncharacterized protein n=1 Tax=Dendrothele bispora (strain CBS 962.96) TaxID=1314807 RepID=A0A4S8KY74_DENBC|nr:hypothetical protein K435DRAFT_873845 [Dendrothele bispora CBS 962.96]